MANGKFVSYLRVSARTKAALAAAKARGTKLGGDRGNLATVGAAGRAKGTQARQEKAKARAGDLAPILASLRAEGVTTLRGLAEALNAREIPTAREMARVGRAGAAGDSDAGLSVIRQLDLAAAT